MNVIDLDSPQHTDTVLFVVYEGTRILINRTRLLDMIRQEGQFLNSFASESGNAKSKGTTGPQVKSAGKRGDLARRADASGMEQVTHASLSYRIKRIFTNAQPSRRLRGAHISILSDLIKNFDWTIPAHPNTRLELHLMEMASWPDTPATLKKVVDAFLERYLEMRQVPNVVPGK